MKRNLLYLLALLAAIGGVFTAIALAADETTGTNVSCATASLPAVTISTNASPIHTIAGTTTTNCHTETFTIPTSTTTVSGSETTPTTSTTETTTTTPVADTCTSPVPGDTQTLNNVAYSRAGWDTFTKDAAVGSFAQSPTGITTGDNLPVVYTGDHGMGWTEYPDGWASTFSGGVAAYNPATVQSVHNGMLDFFLHDSGGHPVSANPSPVPSGHRDQTFGAWSMCERIAPADSKNLNDFKQAILLWPQSDAQGPNSESDYPEGNLNATSMGAFAHHNGTQQTFDTGPLDTSQWHEYTQTWGAGFRSYYLDGKLIGTSTTGVTSTPERWQLQTEPIGASTGATGHVYVRWVWIGSPSSQPTTTTTTTSITPTTTTSSTTSTTTTTPSTGDSVNIASVGDIGGGATSTDFAVKNAITDDNPAAVLMTGDYDNGASPASLSDILATTDKVYGPKPGGLFPIMHPSPGITHDVASCSNQAGYQPYWGKDATVPYSFDVQVPNSTASWHILSIPGINWSLQCGFNRVTDFINTDLSTNTQRCVLAYWHEPYFTSSTSTHSESSLSGTKAWVQALYNHHVSILIGGHQNGDFMAFNPQNPDKQADSNGIQGFVVGTGGQGAYSITSSAANLITQHSGAFGPLILTLRDGSYSWRFDNAAGSAYTASGTGTCKG